MITQWPSPAKLNLYLYITGRRPDGYHELDTLFQFLDYGDTLTFSLRQDQQIHLITPISGVTDQNNLIIRAAKLLQNTTKCQLGVDITINKIIPMGGGLGGGSSNAATVLVALNYLWKCGLSEEQLISLGITLGADVPIFIYGRAAYAEGIGEKLSPASPPEKWYLVVHPGINVSTADIFNDPELKRDSPKLTLSDKLSQPFANDCQFIVQKRYAKVEQLICRLLEYSSARLTGTGACVFAEFDTEDAARQVLNDIPEWSHGFVARGVNISPLRRVFSEMKNNSTYK